MTEKTVRNKMEQAITTDRRYAFTIISYSTVLAIFLNLTLLVPALQQQMQTAALLVGALASTVYLVINGVFLGHFFLEKESLLLKIVFGNLLLLVLLGFVAWIVVIISNLDVIRTTVVLLVATTLASSLNRLSIKRTKLINLLRES